MTLRALAPLAVLLLLAADDKGAKKDADKLQGTWDVVLLELGGQKAAADDLERYRLTIKGDKMSHKAEEKGKTEEATFVLDPSKNPKTIDITRKADGDAGKVLGIYAIDGDTFKLCGNQPGLERPKEFVSKADSMVGLVIFKRAKP